MRKVAANYIFLPGNPLIHNGYIVWEEGMIPEVVDTGGVVRDLAGLEFYGGMIVADYVAEHLAAREEGDALIVCLERFYCENTGRAYRPAIIEGADLRRLAWTKVARLRKL
ncbi:MAG: hypothetical protein K2O69_01560 [Odoribacter sp.]|nr:hypothetical protein [Odoribacter sp.]